MMQTNKKSKNPLYEQLIADGELIRVDLALVDRDPNQPRSLEMIDEAANNLAPSIEQNGLIQSPVYQQTDGGRYLIIVGECRTEAARKLNWETIPAIVKKFGDDDIAKQKIAEIRWAENDSKTRKGLTPLEEAKFWNDYITNFYTVDDQPQVKKAAAHLGENQSKISQYLGIARASNDVKSAIIDLKITDFQLAYLLARMDKHTGLVKTFSDKITNEKIKGGMQVLANSMLKEANAEAKEKAKSTKIEETKEQKETDSTNKAEKVIDEADNFPCEIESEGEATSLSSSPIQHHDLEQKNKDGEAVKPKQDNPRAFSTTREDLNIEAFDKVIFIKRDYQPLEDSDKEGQQFVRLYEEEAEYVIQQLTKWLNK